MRKPFTLLGICFLATVLSAAPLQVVDVSAPNINCFFNTNCTVSGRDVIGWFTLPQTTGRGSLTSRTYMGQPGSPLVGFGAYVYRVDATGIRSGPSGAATIQSLSVPFPPEIIPRDYGHTGMTNGQVWVITHGGSGSVKVASATSFATNIVFVFNPPIQCANGTNAGQSSYFFGMVSTNVTHATVAQIRAATGRMLMTVSVTNTSPIF